MQWESCMNFAESQISVEYVGKQLHKARHGALQRARKRTPQARAARSRSLARSRHLLLRGVADVDGRARAAPRRAK